MVWSFGVSSSPLAHSGVEALVSVAIDRRIVEAVHCGKAVLEIAAAAHVAPATFAAGRGRGVRHRLDLLEDRIAEEVAQRVRFHGMHRRAAVPVERRDIAVVDRYGSVAARDHHLVALAPTLEDRAGRDAAAEMNHRLVDELDMDRLIVLGERSEEPTSELQSLMRIS